MVPKFYQKECENDEEVTDRISPVSLRVISLLMGGRLTHFWFDK